MSFLDYEIKREYRNLEKNIVSNFFMPLMSESVLYQRAVGFFSSSALACYSLGITQLIKNEGRMELIASPELSEQDVEAIDLGYELRDDVIERALINSLSAPVNTFQEERLNLLATYIADEKLEIKIAFVDNNRKIGIYHEKLGLLFDKDGNIVCFSGSMNETENGFQGNYETIDVFCNWIDRERVDDKVKAFEKIWNNSEIGVKTIRYPNIEKAIIEKYKRPIINLSIDEEQYDFVFNKDDHRLDRIKDKITMDEDSLYRYQIDAINKWQEYGFQGIYDMCTGAGKTYTAIGSMKRLFEAKMGRLAIIIVVPFQHLVEQWVEDLHNYNIHPIIGYSNNKYKGYRKKLKSQIFDYNIGARKFLCFICTNTSFKISEVQSILDEIKGDKLLVVDEAHNFGTKPLLKTLKDSYNYRLALSATLDRYGDEEGTEALYAFFGRKCIEYTREQAIDQNKLTEYYYRPQVVYLTEDELERYEQITREMRNYIRVDKKGRVYMSDRAKKLALARARIVAGASQKIGKLEEIIQPYVKDHNLLIYCGATWVEDDEFAPDAEGSRQIEYISKLLGEKYEMNLARFTAEEDMETRRNLISRFKAEEELQGLVAIKCLDEGVNIPSIKTAFILASTTNPKEYIQRRGRVLRTSDNKPYAEIYDMITLPRDLGTARNMTSEEISGDLTLVKNELNRMIEFKNLSLNPYDSNPIIDEIKDTYNLYDIEEFEELAEYRIVAEDD